jgi:maltose alpha-D-glucosyltransferase/alpha-amylase
MTLDFLRSARWFGGKSRAIRDTRVIDRACWVDDSELSVVEVRYVDGPPETYVLADRFDEPRVAREVLARFDGATVPTESGGTLVFRPTHVFQQRAVDVEPVAPMRGEQSNTSIRFGNALILKLFRRLQFGPNPDVEVGWFLTEQSDFRGTPPLAGSLSYLTGDGCEAALALLQGFEPNRGDAWMTTLDRVRRVLEGEDPAESVAAMARLGRTTAELHLALAGGAGDFSAEPITAADVAAWRAAIDDEVQLAVSGLAAKGITLDTANLLHRADGLSALQGSLKARHHGDYHLGQVLERTDGAFVIIDFEGEPAKPLAQRREKRTPLRDVAGMLRSFDYARHAALRAAPAPAKELADAWYDAVREAFLNDYLRVARKKPGLIPDHVEAPLSALELEKAAYEVLYELNNRPDWLPIPLAALTSQECR